MLANSVRNTLNGSGKQPVVTRAFLEAGGIVATYLQDSPALALLTDEERAASLASIMAARPDGDVWVFGYGSLIWNPAFKSVEQRTARIEGWHRAFCMSITAGRASPSGPGLMLGLDGGGHCLGSAFRLDEADMTSELVLLWRREMTCRGAYIPRWVELVGEDGVAFGYAIAFTINPEGEKYAGDMPSEMAVQRLATASGGLGSCADYLFQTRDVLRAHGIPDAALEQLADRVATAQGADRIGKAA
jgi:glutathione-specific gamma-glutamylcyclotransferase